MASKSDDEIIPAAGEPPESAKTVTRGKKSEREISLETKISELENVNQGFKGQVDELTGMLEGARRAPSGRTPGKSLLDDLNDFLEGN